MRNYYKHVFFSILILLMTSLLTGCGFHLRHQPLLPLQLQSLYLQSTAPYGQFTLALRKTLIQQHVKLVPQANSAPVTLNIISTSFTAVHPPVSTTNQATIYQYTYEVNFSLNTAQGKTIDGPFKVTLMRPLIINPSETLYSTDAVNRLETQMINHAIERVLLILSSTHVQKQLNETQHKPA